MNIIAIKGRLTRDPELKNTASGLSVCTITVAVDRNYKKENEERQADFFDCVFWKQAAEFINKYFQKGQEIIVTGEMQSRHYEDKNGNKRTAWEIQNAHAEFCGKKGEASAVPAAGHQPEIADPPAGFEEIGDDDDLPF